MFEPEFPVTIVLDGGVSDRYATRAEAEADLSNHPAGSTIHDEREA